MTESQPTDFMRDFQWAARVIRSPLNRQQHYFGILRVSRIFRAKWEAYLWTSNGNFYREALRNWIHEYRYNIQDRPDGTTVEQPTERHLQERLDF